MQRVQEAHMTETPPPWSAQVSVTANVTKLRGCPETAGKGDFQSQQSIHCGTSSEHHPAGPHSLVMFSKNYKWL